MKTTDLIGSAIGNTFRAKTRTILTILAIFVGAFTPHAHERPRHGDQRLHPRQTVSGTGASDAMTVTKTNTGGTFVPGRAHPASTTPTACPAASRARR